jgi:hypothetical protein
MTDIMKERQITKRRLSWAYRAVGEVTRSTAVGVDIFPLSA